MSRSSTWTNLFTSLATLCLSGVLGVAITLVAVENLARRETVVLWILVFMMGIMAVIFLFLAVQAHRDKNSYIRRIREESKPVSR